jgi:hypothetical protein
LPTNGFSKPTVVVSSFMVHLNESSLIKIEWAGILSIWTNPKVDSVEFDPILDKEGAVLKVEYKSSTGKWHAVSLSEVITDPRFDDVDDDEDIECGVCGTTYPIPPDTCPPCPPYAVASLTPVDFVGNEAIMVLGPGDHYFRMLGKSTKGNPAAPANKNLVARADIGFTVDVYRVLVF